MGTSLMIETNAFSYIFMLGFGGRPLPRSLHPRVFQAAHDRHQVQRGARPGVPIHLPNGRYK